MLREYLGSTRVAARYLSIALLFAALGLFAPVAALGAGDTRLCEPSNRCLVGDTCTGSQQAKIAVLTVSQDFDETKEITNEDEDPCKWCVCSKGTVKPACQDCC